MAWPVLGPRAHGLGRRLLRARAGHAHRPQRAGGGRSCRRGLSRALDAVAGNPQGDVSVVAFFDYNCPYCRKDVPALKKLMAADPNLRVVLKELPVLGPDSEAAARLALAAKNQGEYLTLYRRLIASRGRVTEARALAAAAAMGLDTDRLKDDMNDPAITATLLANTRLADALGVRGVPFYLVGDQVVSEGDGDFYAALTARVADVRQNGCRAAC
ncbi:DsbA family protein [Methyloceanibacter superfactus]|uniref:DsbA family protein n=1 Tax=Methyloceanibacter superfactus TaxID=1774969 RepID=UPI0009F419E1|nr:DsbA family protein [Methyloceanibacter superfactus]